MVPTTPLEIIESYGLSTTSYIKAIADFRELSLNQEQYENGIVSILRLKEPVKFNNEKEASVYFRYCVQETIRQYNNSDNQPDLNEVWEEVQRRSKYFMDNCPWALVEDEPEIETDDNGVERVVKKTKRGNKGAIAEQLFIEMNEQQASRKDIIAAFIEQAGMTKAGATTYFHNFKKKHGFRGIAGTKERKQTKQQIAEQVYLDMKGKDKKEIIAAIIEKTGTTPSGANTYFCSIKKKHQG